MPFSEAEEPVQLELEHPHWHMRSIRTILQLRARIKRRAYRHERQGTDHRRSQ